MEENVKFFKVAGRFLWEKYGILGLSIPLFRKDDVFFHWQNFVQDSVPPFHRLIVFLLN